MLCISEKEIEEAITMEIALPVFRQAYEDSANGLIYAGDRIVMPIRGEANCGQWLVANCKHLPFFGSKFSAVFPGNVSKGMPSVLSKISLYSAETGEMLAIIDANYLTAVKTGGSAAIATDLMAKKDADRLGIIGTGLQAVSQVMAIQEVRALTELHVYDTSPERIEAFIEKIKEKQNRPYQLIAAQSADDCVSAADIVCTCTTSLTPVFSAHALRPGTHINAIGSYTPFMQEIDEETVIKAGKIITEHVDGLWAAAGDILIPFNKGLITKDKVQGSVGDVLTKRIAGRANDEEITLYESVGSCVLDIAIAIEVYKIFNK
jgi:ornithine cyclodeaminase/alanine dehydrogenase-like protein (mu-crystallin family)